MLVDRVPSLCCCVASRFSVFDAALCVSVCACQQSMREQNSLERTHGGVSYEGTTGMRMWDNAAELAERKDMHKLSVRAIERKMIRNLESGFCCENLKQVVPPFPPRMSALEK